MVKEERRMRIENPPFGLLNELITFHAFDVHPYKHPVIGSMTDLNAATIDDVRDFYKTYYVPENATLMIVGDFDVDTVTNLVNQYFGARAEGRQAGAPRHSAGAAAHEGEARRRSSSRGRCRRSSSPTTCRTTAIRIRIRCS